MTAVLDTSAAINSVKGDPAKSRFLPILKSSALVIAPDLFYAEVCNVAWKFQYAGELSPKESIDIAEKAIQFVDYFVPSASLWKEALDFAIKLQHSAYDCYYLVLSQRQNARLLTADKKLITLPTKLGIPAN